MLKETCEATLHLIDEIDYSKPTPKTLLTALLERTIELIDDGYKVDDIMFTTFELIGLVKTGSISENQAKKFKSDHYSETESLLNKINELRDNQNGGNLEYLIELSDTGEKGGAKNKKHHFFKIVEKNNVKSNNESTKDSNSIRYEPVKLPKPNWFAKPFMSIKLTSWRLFIYAAIPLITLLLGCALFVQSFITPSTSELVIFVLFIIIAIYVGKLIFPFYEANHLRITIAPQWLMRFSQLTAQIESIKLDKKRKNGRSYRRLEFVIYEGKCPICNNIVEVEKGKRQFKGRLIGICNESPREHVFSFDHVTKVGFMLN
ncbi:hypothetical protein [Pseudocolwellia agarivorans]|uniref:hypothetical protein n=1 Tax=Pseudocolwellia agarivorans TaxID=1911682 RepID=UPI003F885408